MASHEGHTSIVNALIAAGANVNAARDNDATPLSIASEHGHTSIVDALIRAGANLNAALTHGSTPLYIASQKGHKSIVLSLLSAGADIRSPNFQGKSIFEHANEGTFTPEINELLIDEMYAANEPLGEENSAVRNAAYAARVPWTKPSRRGRRGTRRLGRSTRRLRRSRRN